MARLYRPHIPIETRCRVALRQLGEVEVDNAIENRRPRRVAGYMVGVVGLPGGGLGAYLAELMQGLADDLGCTVEDLRLDHDPPLAAREKAYLWDGTISYKPEANDPDHLFYRPHGPQHERSHLIKTNVRGDHGQHPDRVLIKKAKKLERGPKPKRGRKIGSPGFYARDTKPKRPWPKRKFESRREP